MTRVVVFALLYFAMGAVVTLVVVEKWPGVLDLLRESLR